MKTKKIIYSLLLSSCLSLFAVSIPETHEVVAKNSQENVEVLATYDSFSHELEKAKFSKSDMDRILQAVDFAAKKHASETRKIPEKTPYIIHPIAVANNLLTTGNVRDADVIIAALLHDTLEGTNTTSEEITQVFGKKVNNYVREMTEDSSLPKAERNRLQIANAPKASEGAALIKLSDTLYNLRDLSKTPPAGWSQERIDTYFIWAAKVAHTLPDVNPPMKQAIDNLVSTHFAYPNA